MYAFIFHISARLAPVCFVVQFCFNGKPKKMSSDVSSIYSQDNINSPKSNKGGIYEFENFRLDTAHLMLYKDEKAIALAPKVIETLVALVEKRGEVVSKDELMNRLWRDSFVEESNLTQNIYLLRKTLGKGADGRDLIETFRRRGYRFNGQIKEAQDSEEKAEDAAKLETETPDEQFATNGAATAQIKKSRSDTAFDSLAVLPLTNKSEDPDAEYLSDGVTESIINRLSQISKLRVVARGTVFQYKNREVSPQEVGRALGVSAVLSGRVLRHDERLIVRAELVDTANGWQIWGEQYDRRASDVLDLQETLAREISENLHLKLTREEQNRLTKRYTENSEAYGLFIKGRYFLNKRLTESIERAAALFQQAIDLDPTFALAYVGLADCYPLLSLYGALTPHDAYPKAKAAALKALEIDDRFTKAYNSLGVIKFFYEWDWAGAENAFRQAIELNPGYPDAHQRYGMFLTAVGRFDEAEAELEKARRLDPLSLITGTIGGYPFYYSRRYDEAARRFQEVIAMDAHYSMAHFRLGLTFTQQGKYEAAIAELQKSSSLSNDRDSIAALAYVQGLVGNAEKAVATLAELDEREEAGFVTSYNRALIAIGLNDRDAALDWLEKAYAERSYWLIYLKVDPALDCLREIPRFIELQEKIFGAENAASEIVEAPRRFIETQKNVLSEKRFSGWRLLLSAVAACGVLLFAFFVSTQIFWREKTGVAQTARTANITFKRLTPDIYAYNSAISPDGKYLVYVQLENDKRSLWLKDIATGGAKQIMPPGEDYDAPQFSPDGSQIYFKTARNNRSIIARIPFTGGAPQQIAEDITSPFAISADGKQIAFVREQSLIIAEADGSKRERILSQRGGSKNNWFESWGSQLSWSPDGKTIAICGGRVENGKPRYELTEISVADASERQIPVPNWDYLDSVQWIPDGSGLIVIARETSGSPFQIWRVAYPSGAVATRITQDFQGYKSVSISADSRLLVAAQEIGNRNIWIAPLADAKQAKQITFGAAANDGFWGIALMPDGRVVYTSPRGGNWDLWIMNADGSNQKQLTANAGTNMRPRVSPDGRYIFFVSNRGNTTWRVWRIDADGGNPKQMTKGEGNQDYPTPAPDGQWIYFNRNEIKGSIWKIPPRGGEEVLAFTREYSIGLQSVSPDGKLLVVQKYEKDAPIQWQNGVMQADTGEIVRWLDTAMSGRIGWSADSKSVIFIEYPKAINLWRQPVDGGSPQQLTNFDVQQIRAFDISADDKTLVVSRGNFSIEAVLIENF